MNTGRQILKSTMTEKEINTSGIKSRDPIRPKRSRLSKLRRKAMRLWTRCVKERDGRTCQLCGAKEGDLTARGRPVVINAHHLTGRSCLALRLDLQNGLTLCQSCHRGSALGPHRGPLIFGEWLKRSRPGLTEYLIARSKDPPLETEEQMKQVIDSLKEKLNAMPQMPVR